MAENETYRVFIACCAVNTEGGRTRDSLLAKSLYKKLTENGIHAFLHKAGAPSDEVSAALEQAEILILVSANADNFNAPSVREDYNAFLKTVYAGGKTKWRIVTYCKSTISQDDLPEDLRSHRLFFDTDPAALVNWAEEKLSAPEAKECVVLDEEHEESAGEEESADWVAPEESAAESVSLPDSAAQSMFGAQANASPGYGMGTRARRAAPSCARRAAPSCARRAAPPRARRAAPAAEYAETMEDAAVCEEEAFEKEEPDRLTEPTVSEKEATAPPTELSGQKVKVAKINKVDFSVVAPEKVKPGNSALADVLMYTKSQRKIVQKAIRQAKEKASEAARTTGSVSVRPGSRVTVVLCSDDAVIADNSETLLWNGDALDFQFRFSLPETYAKKQADFSCNILFDGIAITRLYFSIAVNSAKTVPVRFVRKDSKKAFVSYSHKDKQRVVEQLYAIQSVAPQLKFWMDSQSMAAGDLWRPAIVSAIKSADVFLLFWSVSAKNSAEVRKEWEYALALEQSPKRRRNGARFISPVPLDDPKDCPPPAELGDLHFGDPSFDADIEHIEDVHFVESSATARNIRFF